VVVAWGDNSYGQCDVPAWLQGVTDIAAGGNLCIALDSNNKIHAWGDGSVGQLLVPTDFAATPRLAAGYSHAVAYFACPADLNLDGGVDGSDMALLLLAWGTPNGDVDCSGTTDSGDLTLLLATWGSCT
jgi:hypothetical protein